MRIYSDLMLSRLKVDEQLEVESLLVQEGRAFGVLSGMFLGLRLARKKKDLLYIELGAHGTRMAWAALVAGALRRKYVLTVHDGAIGVETMFPFTVLRRLPKPICSVFNRLSRLADAMLRRRLLTQVTGRATVVFSLAPAQVVFGRETKHLPPPSYVDHQRTYVEPDSPVVGFVGFWGRAKGIETLTHALAQLRDEGSSYRAVIGGSTGDIEDSYSTSIRKSAAELGIDVRFPGFIADDHMESFIGGLSVLVIPYLGDHPASSSGVAVWGLALGVPVVASDTPTLRRQLGDNALYFKPGDAEELARALRSVLVDREAAVSRAREGQSRFHREHGAEAIATLASGYIAEALADTTILS
ncbi:glycosyltransferase family 4 protein [Catellatospora chokoriensis]|uniref:glycosyltransferase family 4 protein n=1 Tax=Catellatospora chokoriensis TaxID=310353 RepID=UPI00177D6C91|nr:glycosyltransferase family 4 protein [Catellatospora chokoriensis]